MLAARFIPPIISWLPGEKYTKSFPIISVHRVRPVAREVETPFELKGLTYNLQLARLGARARV